MNEATARAYPNIALVKYWGKRDAELVLPVAGSLSLTLDAFPTTTTVRLDPGAAADSFVLERQETGATQLSRVTGFLDVVREAAGSSTCAEVRSTSEIPTDAGLASSAAGFAALAVAAASAYGLELDRAALSRLARRGSGSATRSVIPGLAVWHAGEDEASFAEPVDGPDVRMVTVTVDRTPKAVSSRAAMVRTAQTSPYYPAWITSTEETLEAALAACRDEDLTALGRLTELHAERMHAVIQACDPPIRYLTGAGLAVFDAVRTLREDEGLQCWATADAGPNVVVLTAPEDAERVAEALTRHGETRVVGAGPGAELVTGTVTAAATDAVTEGERA